MTTRLYFASTRPSDLVPEINGVWHPETVEYARQLSISKLGDSPVEFVTNFSSGQQAAAMRFVSPPLKQQTISGTIKCQIGVAEGNANDNVTSRLEVYVVKANTGQVRGTLLAIGQYGPATEYSTTFTNKSFADGDALTPVDVQNGDRIVVVVGHADSSGADPLAATARFFDLSAAADLPEDETTTDFSVPWIEFSGGISWADDETPPPPPEHGEVEPNPESIGTDYPGDIPPPKDVPPPPWYPPFVADGSDNPATSLHHEGIEEYIYLVRVDGDPNSGFVFRDKRLLSLEYKSLDWWYHRTGGGGTFRLFTKEQTIIADVADDTAWQWELHVRIRLPGELSLRTWYRGIINKATAELSGNELLTDIQGIGYSALLERIWVSRSYPPLTPVSVILNDLIDDYILPNTTIRRSEIVDVTSGGIDTPEYITRGGITLECNVFKALKIIAELEGNVEWGVDSDRNFYWRRENNAAGMGFILDQDTTYIRGGHYSAERINNVRIDAFPLGSTEYQLTRGDITDITDITSKGEHNIVAEAPWFKHPTDAAHWADNIIVARRRLLHWRIIGWNEVTARVEGNHPLLGLPVALWRDGNDVTTGFSRYQIDKIHYIKGGLKLLTEILEKGRTRGSQLIASIQLKAEIYIGNPPKHQGEILDAVSDQVEALKSRNKLRRYPRDVTDFENSSALLDVTGKIPGEIVHYRKDITNIDLPNDEDELQDEASPRGVLAAWLSKQWTKISIRRTFMFLPARGLFIGEMVALYTDLTNQDEGTLYWWNGNSWNQIGTGSSVSDLVFTAEPTGSIDVSEVTDVPIVSTDISDVAVGDQLIVEGSFVIANDSGLSRIYTVTTDFNGSHDVELITGGLNSSGTDEHPIEFKTTLAVNAVDESISTHGLMYYSATPSAAGADQPVVTTGLRVLSWGESADDLTGIVTVTLSVRSSSGNPAQTLRLVSMTIRKVRPTG